MALNRSDKSRILRRYFPGMTRNSEMSTEPNTQGHCSRHLGLPTSPQVTGKAYAMTVWKGRIPLGTGRCRL